jgi:sugar O-acyltransferase (sialic acid O-acetyltransferase NeuD family)
MKTNSMRNQSYYLYGASGHGKVVAEILEMQNLHVNGFFDDDYKKNQLSGFIVYHSFHELQFMESALWIISIGINSIRKEITIRHPFPFGTALHPSAVVSTRASIGEGTVVMPGACINSCAVVGRHAIINTNASVDHDCVLADFVHISPGASLAGSVRVGEGTHIGTGASVIPGVTIGKWCTIGAGAVVIRDVPDGVTVVGVPGRGIQGLNE